MPETIPEHGKKKRACDNFQEGKCKITKGRCIYSEEGEMECGSFESEVLREVFKLARF